MLESSLAHIIIRSLPESILVILAGFILLDLDIDKNKILKVGLIFGFIVTSIRLLPLAYGTHTILAMMVCGFILAMTSKLPVIQPFMATCGILLALASSEGIYVMIATGPIGIPIGDLLEISARGAILSMPSLLIFMSMIMIMKLALYRVKYKSS